MIYETDTGLSLIYNGSAWVSPSVTHKPPAVRALATGTTQTIPTGGATTIQFPAEEYDTDGMHDNSTNNSRLTVNTAGLYLFTCWIQTGATSGARYIYIYKNGSYYIYTPALVDPVTAASGGIAHTITGVVKCSAGDYLEAAIFHNTGSSVGVGTNSWASATYLGQA
jgi:hypothetical protein